MPYPVTALIPLHFGILATVAVLLDADSRLAFVSTPQTLQEFA